MNVEPTHQGVNCNIESHTPPNNPMNVENPNALGVPNCSVAKNRITQKANKAINQNNPVVTSEAHKAKQYMNPSVQVLNISVGSV